MPYLFMLDIPLVTEKYIKYKEKGYMGNVELQVKVSLKDEMLQRFELIKKHYGLRTNAETIRLIVQREYENLQREKRK